MFSFLKKEHPIKKFAYAVTTGAYVGEILVFVEETSDNYNLISIPKNENREIPKDKFEMGLIESIVEEVEQIPKDIYELLEKQYLFNINNTK
jgi:hypothetical protein